MVLRKYFIVKYRGDETEKFQTFYTTSKAKMIDYKDFQLRIIATFHAAVVTEMSLEPLPEVEYFEPKKK